MRNARICITALITITAINLQITQGFLYNGLDKRVDIFAMIRARLDCINNCKDEACKRACDSIGGRNNANKRNIRPNKVQEDNYQNDIYTSNDPQKLLEKYEASEICDTTLSALTRVYRKIQDNCRQHS